jgi:NADH:ubiquinone oxidoreductase subunit 5 (subunit L)/multisubunit Na+/H+ antiporter MnhA subunit
VLIDGIVNGAAFLTRKFSQASILFDTHVVDGAVNGVAEVNRFVSSRLRKVQTGYISHYALAIVIGLCILVFLILIF